MRKGGPGGRLLFLSEGKYRRELVAVGENDAGSQPVPRERRETLRRDLVVPRGYQLSFLRGAPRAGEAQRSLHFFRRERRPALVFDVQDGSALLHDQLDRDLIVAPAHDSAVLGLVVAVSVCVAQGERLQNRRDRRQRDLHWSRLTQFDIP